MTTRKDARSCLAADLQVGRWHVQPALNQIRDRNTIRHLEPQVINLLVFLASNSGRVVSKDQIIDGVWEGRFIAEATLTRSIADLRRALGDNRQQPEYIETIAKRGYRLVAPVSHFRGDWLPPEDADTGSGDTRPAPHPEPSLVVLPFANFGPAEDQFFCEGLTDEVISALTRFPGLRVISRTSAFAAHGRGGDIADIGRSLQVTHAIEGSVRRAGGRIRVTAQLVRVSDHGHVWSERYDRDMVDVFGIQDEIADAIARRLELTLNGLAPRGQLPTSNMEAYGRFVEGRHHFLRGTIESLECAKRCFTEVIQLDPAFAPAHDALSEVYWYMGFYGLLVPKEAFTLAVWESLRAIEIDDRSAESHALLAMLRKELDYNWTEVNREFARALELNPHSPVVRMRYALCGLMPHGRNVEAAAELEHVVETDPLSINVRWWLASMYMFSRQWQPMRQQVDRMLEIDPRHPLSHMTRGNWLLTHGESAAAAASFETASELAGRPTWLLGWLGLACGAADCHDRARAIHDELQTRAATRFVSPFAFGLVSLGLGDIDDAFQWMDRAIDVRDPLIVPIKSYPFLDHIRSDPRYTSLLTKMNFSDAPSAEASVPSASILRP